MQLENPAVCGAFGEQGLTLIARLSYSKVIPLLRRDFDVGERS